jgi:putative transposase
VLSSGKRESHFELNRSGPYSKTVLLGLEDFMHVTPNGVTNAANLSSFMVNVAYRLQADVRQRAPDYSILDLKADCRGYKYVEETIKMLPEKPKPVLLAKILHQVAGLGRIHVSPPSFSFS